MLGIKCTVFEETTVPQRAPARLDLWHTLGTELADSVRADFALQQIEDSTGRTLAVPKPVRSHAPHEREDRGRALTCVHARCVSLRRSRFQGSIS